MNTVDYKERMIYNIFMLKEKQTLHLIYRNSAGVCKEFDIKSEWYNCKV